MSHLANLPVTPFYEKSSGAYFIVVGELVAEKKIVASATLLLEHKFIHGCGIAGQVEDVVVDKSMRGRNLGLKLIEALKFLAQELGCYKLLLDCSKVRMAGDWSDSP